MSSLYEETSLRCEPTFPRGTSSPTYNSQTLHLMGNDNNVSVEHNQNVMLDVHKGRSIRLHVKVSVPVNDHPNVSKRRKLLGPKGNSLKWLQEQTLTKIAILGKGSMRDKEKEEELRKTGDPKYSHLNEDLHVDISAFAPAPEAYSRIGHALHEVKRFLVPDYYDEIRQQQLRELGILNCEKPKSNERSIQNEIGESFKRKETPHSFVKASLRCKQNFHQLSPTMMKQGKLFLNNGFTQKVKNDFDEEIHHSFNLNEENDCDIYRE
ncbi:KH domain-containing: RNA-binding: signal transduction-associated protein 3-like protein [Dinothrombium tinctorium]|uniref:KH domain-containing: RNA-binding: signal transduction-associated protein 3-like protein n=1 Tax=Dinothrombium tinctorium TaxID=1965070 RepID=A0A443RM09_9ACAR|nr:KH domain-containing: RNA-binding: signal transduction-associated protein 3-like protein [Dinothrombium tinctorium]